MINVCSKMHRNTQFIGIERILLYKLKKKNKIGIIFRLIYYKNLMKCLLIYF